MLGIIIENQGKVVIDKPLNEITVFEFNALHKFFIEIIEHNQEIQNHYLDNKMYET